MLKILVKWKIQQPFHSFLDLQNLPDTIYILPSVGLRQEKGVQVILTKQKSLITT